jgi:hypothetical protein
MEEVPGELWRTWHISPYRQYRVLLIVFAKNLTPESQSSREKVKTAAEKVLRPLRPTIELLVLSDRTTTLDELERFITHGGKSYFTVIHIVAHSTKEGTPHCPDPVRPHMELGQSREWWAKLMKAASPKVVVLSCCKSVDLAVAVLPYVGVCIYTEKEIQTERMASFIGRFYESLFVVKCSIVDALDGAELYSIEEERKMQGHTGVSSIETEHSVRPRIRGPLPERLHMCQPGKGSLDQVDWDSRSGGVCNHELRTVVPEWIHEFQLQRLLLHCRHGDQGEEDNLVDHSNGKDVNDVWEVVKEAFQKRIINVVGWPGFGRTRLCREILQCARYKTFLDENKATCVVLYVACKTIDWGVADLISILSNCCKIWTVDVEIMIEKFGSEKEKVIPVWLLDDFDENVDAVKAGQLFNIGVVIRFLSRPCDVIHFSLRPLSVESDGGLLQQVQRIPNKVAQTSDRTVPVSLIDDLVKGVDVDSNELQKSLKHHPIWVKWAYDRDRCCGKYIGCDEGENGSLDFYGFSVTIEDTSFGELKLEEQVDSINMALRLSRRKSHREERRFCWMALFFTVLVSSSVACVTLGGFFVGSSVQQKFINVTLSDSRISRVTGQFPHVYVGILGILLPGDDVAVVAFPGSGRAKCFATRSEANASISAFQIGKNFSSTGLGELLPFDDTGSLESKLNRLFPNVLLSEQVELIKHTAWTRFLVGVPLLCIGVPCAIFVLIVFFVSRVREQRELRDLVELERRALVKVEESASFSIE